MPSLPTVIGLLAVLAAQAQSGLDSLFYEAWLEEVAPLMRPAERAAFAELDDDLAREAFVRRFWEVRDPTPGTGRNELRDRWLSPTAALAAGEARGPHQEAVMRLLGSRPRLLHRIDCRPLPPLEVWYFSRGWLPPLAPGVGTEEPFRLLFVRDEGTGVLRQVSPDEVSVPWGDGRSLEQRLERVLRWRRCILGAPGGKRSLEDLRLAFAGALRWEGLLARLGIPTPPELWFEDVKPEPELDRLAPELRLSFPGSVAEETVVRGLLRLPAPFGAAGIAFPREGLVLAGEVFLFDDVMESFRYTFHGLSEDVREAVPIRFERSLPPGKYGLRLRLEDLEGEPLWSETRRMVVPRLDDEPPRPQVDPKWLDAEDVLVVPDRPSVQIQVPSGGLLAGEVPVTALVTGFRGTSVRFDLDGRTVARDADPPFEARIDLGESPRRHTLRAVAVDAGGRVVAQDRVTLNAGPHRFAVRLSDPSPGAEDDPVFTARAVVELPTGTRLDRLELEVDGELRATLYDPPFVQPLAVPENQEVVFVRAVAHLTDGRTAEDVTLVRGGPYGEELEVQLVELYTTVLDPSGRPVTDLGAEDFDVYDEGEPQPLHGFSKLQEIPLHLCLTVDVSSSMERDMGTVRETALSFFEQVLTEEDRAAIVAFDHRVQIVEPLTRELEDLERTAEDLRAVGGTALYDALVVSLHYLGGLEGKRAVVLLSDGHDQHSRFDLEHVQHYARRAGIAIYAIALGSDLRTRPLRRLARETGGRAYRVRIAAQLPEVFEEIEQELRARYLLTYQAPDSEDGTFRRVRVEVARPGLEARTLAGYYPE